MSTTFTPLTFATHLTMTALEMRHHQRTVLEEVGRGLQAEIRSALGTYRYGWPALQPATVARKRNGDTPLVETGALRNSYLYTVVDHETVDVGSDDPKAIWHEFGTGHVPPRPVLLPAAQAYEPTAVRIMTEHGLAPLLTQRRLYGVPTAQQP